VKVYALCFSNVAAAKLPVPRVGGTQKPVQYKPCHLIFTLRFIQKDSRKPMILACHAELCRLQRIDPKKPHSNQICFKRVWEETLDELFC